MGCSQSTDHPTDDRSSRRVSAAMKGAPMSGKQVSPRATQSPTDQDIRNAPGDLGRRRKESVSSKLSPSANASGSSKRATRPSKGGLDSKGVAGSDTARSKASDVSGRQLTGGMLWMISVF